MGVGVGQADVDHRDPGEITHRVPDPVGQLPANGAELDIDERGLRLPVRDDEHRRQEVEIDALCALVGLGAPASVGDAERRGDDCPCYGSLKPQRHCGSPPAHRVIVISRSATGC